MHLLSCKCLRIFVTPPHLVCTVPQYFIFIHSTHRKISTYLEIRIGRFFFFYTRQNMITQQDSEKTFCRIINTFRNLSVHPEFLITLQTPGLRHTYTILGGNICKFCNHNTIEHILRFRKQSSNFTTNVHLHAPSVLFLSFSNLACTVYHKVPTRLLLQSFPLFHCICHQNIKFTHKCFT